MVDAVILAGGNAKGLAPVPAKGLVPINGKPMVDYVIDALCRCEDIGRICVVLPVEYPVSSWGERVQAIKASGSLPDVAKAGLDFLATQEPVLVVSADVPLITPEAISDFLRRCARRDSEMCYPIVAYGESEKRFPGVKRTYVRTREGRFTGGNILLLRPAVIANNRELIERVFELRKSPLRLSRALGVLFLLRFLSGRLSIRQIEERVSAMTRAVCAGVETPFSEVGIDVDKESDLALAAIALSGGSNE